MHMQHVEKEIIDPVQLCQSNGTLNPQAIGYARRPIIQSNLTKKFMRKKKWNYWCIFGEEILFSVTISHFDYAAVCFVYMLNYETERYIEKKIVLPFSRRIKMSEHVLDHVSFSHAQIDTHITHAQNETKMTVIVPDFEGERLEVDLDIFHPIEDDSLNVVIPRNRNIFQFTSKHHTLPTTGTITFGQQQFNLQSDHSFAVLDYGRGIWEKNAEWNWAMASQRIGNRRIGLNFGGTWTDGTGMTENAIFIDGKMTKIHEDMKFIYDPNNPMKQWKIMTKFSNHVQLSFIPFSKHIKKTTSPFMRSEVLQLIGYYNGIIQLPNCPPLYIRNMLGCAEEHHAKW